jgi:hypothetical protein
VLLFVLRMELRVLKCPHCGAPLSAGRFQRQVVCAFCKTQVQIDPTLVHASRFKEALAQWSGGGARGDGPRLTIAEDHFRLLDLLAHGEISDVHAGERDRWPTERVLLKILREPADRPLLEAEHAVLSRLQASNARGAERFTTLLPQPLFAGEVRDGPFAGRAALVLRWAPGFHSSLADARRALPRGVPPVISVWMWRRVLEALTFLHASGVVHGAVLPRHLLVQEGDHGMRLVGFSCAGASGEPLRAMVADDERLYPEHLRGGGKLTAGDDVRMSARSIAFALGGDGPRLELPAAVPPKLAALVAEVGDDRTPAPMPWELRERIGALARELFGEPSFHPLKLPA